MCGHCCLVLLVLIVPYALLLYWCALSNNRVLWGTVMDTKIFRQDASPLAFSWAKVIGLLKGKARVNVCSQGDYFVLVFQWKRGEYFLLEVDLAFN